MPRFTASGRELIGHLADRAQRWDDHWHDITRGLRSIQERIEAV